VASQPNLRLEGERGAHGWPRLKKKRKKIEKTQHWGGRKESRPEVKYSYHSCAKQEFIWRARVFPHNFKKEKHNETEKKGRGKSQSGLNFRKGKNISFSH